MGRVLFSRNVAAGTAEQSLDLVGYPAGMYCLQWREEGQEPVAARVILQRR